MIVDRGGLPEETREKAEWAEVGRGLNWLAAGVLGLIAICLIHLGVVDAVRVALASTVWRLDELLLVLLAAGLGMLLASHVSHRQARRNEARWAAERSRTHELACRDPLTGLFNRRGLDELARRPFGGQARTLLLVDLDEFKHVNDTHGHGAGDDVLRRFGDRLREAVDGIADACAVRLGGDEFVLILDGEPEESSAAIWARILYPLHVPAPDGGSFSVSLSAGITHWPAGMPIEIAIEQADIAMYEAKRTGDSLCRFDRVTDEPGASPRRLKRMFERELSILPDREARICVAAISPDRYYTAKRSMGHGYAAQVLRTLREALKEHGSGLLIERIAPDTLAVLFAAEDIAEATEIVEKLAARCSQVQAPDGSLTVEALTLGLAGPASAASVRETVEQAQLALDEARRSGRRQVVFDLVEQERANRNVDLMSELRQAIATDQLELHYQPKLSSRTGEIDSMEALVRWRHPDHGAIPPAVFVPISEASGDVEALTYWVIQRAMRDWDALEAAGMARTIYVNVSAQLIGDTGFADRLLAILDGPPNRIGIEITETAVLDNPTHALRHLRQIAAAGISIAIDDYGVGLSSLSYLKQLPATELKIDMSFITHLADSHRDPMIVRSTIDLAHGLGLRVTAEGVDKPEVLTLLKIMGCDMIQGYQISAALPVEQLMAFMRDHDSTAEHVPECAAQFLELVNG
ncbi:MAG: hypothetical protein JWL91_371 [Sphingomonas bacterium]|nr:EAL domain-containing protein [Sphingomonas bacterium]MDB5688495.1 hypothetical protein [Sphingomonas bacterium]